MDILTANDRIGEYPRSWYADTAEQLPVQESASGDISCDVCVIGAGFTGLSAALHLAERGYDVVLLDAHRIGWGASGRNGGQVSTGQRLDQEDLEKMVGSDMARDLFQIGCDAVELLRDLDTKHDAQAGFVPGVVHADHRNRYVAHSHAYAEKLQNDYGYEHIRALDREELRMLVGSDAYYGGTLDLGSGHIHPLRFAIGLARACLAAGVRIFEKSRVTELVEGDPAQVRTNDAVIRASYVVLGCNGYLGDLQGRVAARVMPINNFIAATEPLDPALAKSCISQNHAVADSKFVINYFRLSEDNRMLFGGTESYGYRFPKDIAGNVRRPMEEIFPQLRGISITHAWGGTLGITMNRMPHFARVSGNILSASGYSGQGVAMATMGGKLAAEAIAGQSEKFDILSTVPTPRFPGGVLMRWPLLVLAMVWFSMRDRL